jgi:hypothetical protein
MSEIRIRRTVSVPPQSVRDFMAAVLEVSNHSEKTMGVDTDVFVNVHNPSDDVQFCIFTDFDSLAQYEEKFLHRLLSDSKYLDLAENAASLITDEPRDELFVRLKPDDYFMNLRGDKKPAFAYTGRKPTQKTTYRRSRLFKASPGRLREVMQMNFEFLGRIQQKTGLSGEYFCTRFAADRIGGSEQQIDTPTSSRVLDAAFWEQDAEISSKYQGLLLTRPVDTLYRRVTAEDVTFRLADQLAYQHAEMVA